jgi:UDP-N-acetylglucosamine 2-epimerase (non-hydrolysing)
MAASYFILTDSGGIQEEAPALGKPVLVLREQTERPEAVAVGVARVVGTDEARIFAEASRLMVDPEHYAAMSVGASPYGDGRSAPRILQLLRTALSPVA